MKIHIFSQIFDGFLAAKKCSRIGIENENVLKSEPLLLRLQTELLQGSSESANCILRSVQYALNGQAGILLAT